ncbi:hypothetical protein Nepgr_004234 [Nepenthes gracilis]|uniref:Uncharacterized protein n=1 Tax=Nepenthes gracilis TaxID=150966 RepID=A0AAD3S0Z2_NEPGR|nr:hypothetical protein Nepgr_004234 [Nepenthes gracilis]
MEDMKVMLTTTCNSSDARLPESPRLPMEFLSRSWSLHALQLSKSLSLPFPPSSFETVGSCAAPPISEEDANAAEEREPGQRLKKLVPGNSFSFASSATSQLVLERIMSQTEVSPLTSGRPSSSEPIANGFSPAEMGTPPLLSPPRDFDHKFLTSNATPQPLLSGSRVGTKSGCGTLAGGGSKTVGRWLKDRRERKKEETRAQNAQLHAAISVAAVAAALAATAAATAAASGRGKDEQAAMADMAVATATTLVAARCVEAAEAMGAEHDHLASVISSAVNVQSHGDIMTLTAAAATALRGAATLKARTRKEGYNIASVLPVQRGLGIAVGSNADGGNCHNDERFTGEDFFGLCNERLLARGGELLKRTRTGEFHWKIISVYINKLDQVVLKMKSKHAAGTITKKKKKVLLEVLKEMPPWPERCVAEGGEKRRYFGLKTVTQRVIEFECKNQQERKTPLLNKSERKGEVGWRCYVGLARVGTVGFFVGAESAEVLKEMPPWPERCVAEGGEKRRYFGLKTVISTGHRVRVQESARV